jgi:diguanylate cyclase (GGDEF)-like protein
MEKRTGLRVRVANFLERLAFLKGNYQSVLIWPVTALIVAAIGWFLLLSWLDRERNATDQAAIVQTATQARMYAENLTGILEAIDQIALFVMQGWELSDGMLHLEDLARRGLLPESSQFHVAIFDRQGSLLTGTLHDYDDIDVIDVRGKPFFASQMHAMSNYLFIGKPLFSEFTQSTVIHFSRRLEDANGNFQGVVMVSVPPSHFTTSFDESALGRGGFLAVVASDNTVLALRTGGSLAGGPQRLLHAVPDMHAHDGSMRLGGKQWFTDDGSRYVGWRTVDGYPVIAVTGIDRNMVLQPHLTTRTAALRSATAATLALALFTLVATTLALLLAWRKHQLAMTQATYRIATEGGTDGFYIARPVYDLAGVVTDFTLIDCNERGAALLRQRREDLLGRQLSAIYEGADPTRLANSLMRAMKEGFFESEVEISSSSPVLPRWLHLRIVRPDGDLAITMRDISDAKAHVAELERRGNEDALTGLPNRHWFNTYLPGALERCAGNDAMLALLFIDLDGFKVINDTMGHDAGDELLRNAGRRLKLAVRPHDYVVRIGGDEFVVILEQVAAKEDAAHVAERILHAFREPFRLSQGSHSVGTSIGISIFPFDGTDAPTLLKNADIAMYSVKMRGKRNFNFYDQRFYEALRLRHERELELRDAIEHDQFVMYYQPRIDVTSGTPCSMEALIRWTHPKLGLLEPNEFIPLAEETGLVVQLGELVIEKVCAQLARWARNGQALVPVSINVSPRQFSDANVVAQLSAAFARHDIEPSLVEIELTESSMMRNAADITAALNTLQRMGVKLLVDDFGTGYSSLSQLQQLDFDVLKVDRAFTARLDMSEEGNVFYTAIITMAHALGMRVVAEGVESLGQLNVLKALQCDEIQGFYISKPLPPAEFQLVTPYATLQAT